MGALFGKSKKVSRITEQDKAVLQLKQQRDKLRQYQKKVELQMGNDLLYAKKCLAMGNKDRAKLMLRKKRYQMQVLNNTDSQLENLERLVNDIEFAQVELQVVNGLKVGNAALKKANALLDINEIQTILEETREGVEKQREIDDLLSGALTEDDELAAEEELERLISQDEEKIHLVLPKVPTDVIPEVDEEEEEAAQELPMKTKEKASPKRIALEA